MASSVITDGSGTSACPSDIPQACPPRFVGRDAEAARLAAALARPPAVVLVEGEAGIGKSRLVREFLAAPPGRRRKTLLAACPPFGQPLTLGPVVDALRQAADDIRGLGLSALAGALRPLFPEWADGLPPAPEPLEDASATRHRLFRALTELLDRLRVAVLAVEDVHWADEATLEFLLFLAARQSPGLSLIVTYRPEDVPDGSLLLRLSSRLPAGTTCGRITLGPLDVTATAELVASMLPGGLVSGEFAAFLHAHTDGLPLAVEESVRLLRDRGDLRRRDGEWVRRHLDALAVPPTVRDAVLERAARLGPQAQAVLRAAAVLAGPSAEPVLLSASGLSAGEAGRGLAGALGCGLLREDQPNGQGLIWFRHALAARAVYEAIPARQRRELHLRAGRALERVSPPPVAQLARHSREAGQTADWVRYAEQAADLALASGDDATAARLLHDIATHASLPPGAVVRVTRKIPINALTGYTSLCDLAASLRSVLGNDALTPIERAEAGFQLGRVLGNAGEYQASAVELERAIPGLAHRPVEAAHAMLWLGWPDQTLWPVSVHRRWLDRATPAIADPAISSTDRLALTVNQATALLDLGEESGWAVAAQIPEDAATAQLVQHIAVGYLNTSNAAMRWGRYGEAKRRLVAALQMANRQDYPRLHDVGLMTLAHLDWFTGEWGGLSDRAVTLTGLDDVEPLVRLDAVLVAGLLDTAAGAYRTAEEKLRLVLDEGTRRGIVDMLLEPAAVLARLRLLEDRGGDALDLTDEPMRVITAKGIWIWATDVAPVRVQALVAVGRTGEAAKVVTAFAWGLRGRKAPAPQASLATCRAILVEGRGDHVRAAALFGRAAAAWRALPRPYDALLARERQARCQLTAGRSEPALALLAEVWQGLSALGAGGDADRVERSLREHGVRTASAWRGGRRGYGDRLSPRETEVVRLAAAGRTNRQIAQELYRSPKTVEIQLSSAMRKLGVSSRTALALRVAGADATAGGHSQGSGQGSPPPLQHPN